MSKKKSPAATLAQSFQTDTSYSRTASPDGKIEASILMHSRMGIRIELNLHRCELLLWISPQAGKSLDYHDRNFSCRDDHTSIFDRISFPELSGKPFVKCDYDPFHCVLHFEGQTLHLATLIDQPVVLVWAAREEVVDFKTDKQDSLVRRSDRAFGVRHPDRGKVLDFCAALGAGKGTFRHQPEVDSGRSTYARVVISPGQLLVIGGELATESVGSIVTRLAGQKAESLLKESERKIARALEPATLSLKGRPEMQKLYDINKRHLLSVQDASGVIRAALKYVYYLIWATDGAVTTTGMFQTGWRDYLERWMEFMLSNPTSQQAPPHGRFYGQLVNGKITKREEFGNLCAVWPAFMHWGLTGDDRFVSGKFLRVLEDVVDWMDRYCFDEKLGAIGSFYLGGGSEDPFYGSNDFGWDAAVGAPMNRNCYAPRHEGHLMLRSYDFTINLNQYNMHLMLSVVTKGRKSEWHRAKAKRIEAFLCRLLEENAQAYYLLEGKGLVQVKYPEGEGEYGLLAVQSQSPAFFMPRFAQLYVSRSRSFNGHTADSLKNKYACVVFGRMAGLDTEFVDEDVIMRSLELSLPYNVQPSRYIPMPYTMVEFIGAEDGAYHDIRPQAFSTGPFQAAVTNLAVRTMPFGIAVRATKYIRELRHFDYMGGQVNIRFSGFGQIGAIELNGRPLEHTLQIPDKRLKPGGNDVAVTLEKRPPGSPVLVYSTVRLLDVKSNASAIEYQLTGYCQNVLVLRGVCSEVVVSDRAGRPVECQHIRDGEHVFVEFWGKGDFIARVLRQS